MYIDVTPAACSKPLGINSCTIPAVIIQNLARNVKRSCDPQSSHPQFCRFFRSIMPPMDDRRTPWLQISTLYMVTFIDAQCRKASRELNHPQLLPLALMFTPQPSQELHETVSYKKLKVLRVTETFPLLWKVHS